MGEKAYKVHQESCLIVVLKNYQYNTLIKNNFQILSVLLQSF